MEALIALLVIVLLALPILGIVSYFKTQRLMKDTIGDLRSEISLISVKISEIQKALKIRTNHSASPEAELHVDVQRRPQSARVVEDLRATALDQNRLSAVSESKDVQTQTVAGPVPVDTAASVSDTKEHLFVAPLNVPVSEVPNRVDVILSKIWNWIVVGEEHRNPKVSMEFAVASTWLLRLGIIALVVCVGFFLMWSIDEGILGPSGRVSLAVLAGLGMMIGGVINLNNKYRLLAEGLLGGGLAFLYFAIYAAGPMYHLVSTLPAFGLMSLVTIVSGVLALRTGSQLVAILGIIGGYATPVMLSTGQANFSILYSYMILLGLGILGIAHYRHWRLLNYLAFIFTWGLFFGSLDKYDPVEHFTIAIVFLSVLFMIHSTIVFYYNLLRKEKSSLLEILHLLLNSILFAATSYNLIVKTCGKPWPAVMAIALALFFIIHIYVFIKGRQHDRNILIVFIGLAGFFTAWAVPLITEKETLTTCWALLAFFILWVGLKLNSNMLVGMSSMLYIVVMGRLAFLEIPENFEQVSGYAKTFSMYAKNLPERLLTFGTVIGSLFGAFFIYRRKETITGKFGLEKENNIPWNVPYPALIQTSFWCGIGFIVIALLFEFGWMFSSNATVQTPVLTSIIIALGLLFVYFYLKDKKEIFLFAAIIVSGIAICKLVFHDFSVWGYLVHSYVYKKNVLDIFMRLIDYGAVFLLFALLIRSTAKGRKLHIVYVASGAVLLFWYLSIEVNTLFHWYIPIFQNGAVSVLWALFAISYLLLGIRTNIRAWRYCGLVLFTVVLFKVFFIDLSEMETIFRVIAFMIVGVLLIGGAFAYMKSDKKFITEEKK